MTVHAQNSCTLSHITDVQAVYTYYYLASSDITSNMAPKDNVNAPGASTIRITYNGVNYDWTLTEPTLNIVDDVIQTAVGKLYFMECTLFSDSTYDWGPLMTSSTYAAAKAAYNLSSQALANASAAKAVTDLMGGHFIYGNAIPHTSTSAGARVVEQIEEDDVDLTTTPSKWHHNVNIGANGIQLRYNEAVMAQLAANQSGNNTALKFYKPPSISGNTTTQGALAMELTSSDLKFYGSSSTADATLSSAGLVLSKGGITVNTVGSNDGMYISSENLGSAIPSLVPTPSSGTPKTNWRAIIGSKFGVDSEGNLYANEAHISGTFTVKAGSESNIYTKDESDEKVQEEVEKVISVKEASGNIVHVEDASEYPALELTATIIPKQSGTGTPSPDNIRPISGWESVEVFDTDVNVWDEEWEVGWIRSDGSNAGGVDNIIRSVNYIPVLPNTDYYFNVPDSTDIIYFDINKNSLGNYDKNGNGDISPTSKIRCTQENCHYIRFWVRNQTTYNHDISINYPPTDHDYHAYTATTHTTSLGRTVYGGTVDVVSGVLTVDKVLLNKAIADMNNSDSYPGWTGVTELENIEGVTIGQNGTITGINGNFGDLFGYNTTGTNRIVYLPNSAYRMTQTEWQTNFPNDYVQFVVPLATPQTYQLTPQTINTLAGVNNVWVDSGNVYLKYATMNPDMQALMGNATGTKADKTAALSRSQRIYYRSTSIQNLDSLSGPTTWLSTSGTGYENWSLSIPQLTNGEDSYPYLYTCVQNQTAAQYAAGSDCTCTPVVSDDSTTVIDGGSITTGQILANYIESDGLYINSAQVGDLDELLGDKQDVGDYMTNDEYDDKIKDIAALFNTLNGQIIFDDDGKNTYILLQNHAKGNPDLVNGIQAKLTAGKLAFGTFGQTDNEVAYFSSEELKVQKRLSFGNFVMKQRDNGHLSIMFEGGDD